MFVKIIRSTSNQTFIQCQQEPTKGLKHLFIHRLVMVILNIFDKETGKTIATHMLSNERGKLISNTSHKRDRSIGLDELEKQIQKYLGNDDFTQSYLDKLHVDKNRDYRDNLHYLIREMI